MFFCEECRERNQWPESMHVSYGPCEVCRVQRECHDVASSILRLLPPQNSYDYRQELDEA